MRPGSAAAPPSSSSWAQQPPQGGLQPGGAATPSPSWSQQLPQAAAAATPLPHYHDPRPAAWAAAPPPWAGGGTAGTAVQAVQAGPVPGRGHGGSSSGGAGSGWRAPAPPQPSGAWGAQRQQYPQPQQNYAGGVPSSSAGLYAPPALAPQPATNAILVGKRQQGNPLLQYIRNVRWQHADVGVDYVLGASTCALFISLR